MMFYAFLFSFLSLDRWDISPIMDIIMEMWPNWWLLLMLTITSVGKTTLLDLISYILPTSAVLTLLLFLNLECVFQSAHYCLMESLTVCLIQKFKAVQEMLFLQICTIQLILLDIASQKMLQIFLQLSNKESKLFVICLHKVHKENT